MKFILSQISVESQYEKNLDKILSIICNNEFDVSIFPELSLTSYDLSIASQLDNEVVLKSLKVIQKNISKEQMIIVGTQVMKKKKLYNALAIITSEKISYYYKNNLTKYDNQYFAKGKNKLVFKFKGKVFGFLICRDQNNFKLMRKYRKHKCDFIIHLSAHYYDNNTAIKKLEKNTALPIARAIDTNAMFLKVNTVGYNAKKEVSLGRSMIVDKNGNVLRKANMFTEEIIKFNTKDRKWL